MSANDWIDSAIRKAVSRLREMAGEAKDFPHIAERDGWRYTPDGVWTGGFWAGALWLAFEQSGDEALRRQAILFTDRLLPRAYDTHNHDLGFMFYPSAVKGWRLTGDERYLRAAKDAAVALAAQYNPAAGFIPGWGFFGAEEWNGSVLVDTLMNLPLLVWAAQQGGDRALLKIVQAHVKKTTSHHLRGDGSVYHVYKFDPRTGEGLGGDTYQGLGPESSWARGQSWAIAGLAILAAMTGDLRHAKTSERVADYFVRNLPEDSVPPWDFTAAGPDQPKDSSAGAIASYGLLKLYGVTGDRRHLEDASKLLRALMDTCGAGSDGGGLLLHATADLPHGLGIDGATIYGDYYYLKSLMALRRLSRA